MPLGGIGAGHVAVAGDGSLRQWQIFNLPNHIAHIPHSFFAVRVRRLGEDPEARILQSDEYYDAPFEPVPLISDHMIPDACRELLRVGTGVESVRFTGAYPVAILEYRDRALPLAIELEAFTPFAPLDPDRSGMPGAVFRFTLRNPGARRVDGTLLATLQNAVGYDGVSPVTGTECPSYGGNQNRIVRDEGLTAVEMTTTSLPPGDPHWGEMALAALETGAHAVAHWDNLEAMWREFAYGRLPEEPRDRGPSPRGRTWNGAVQVPFHVEPGEERTLVFLLTWYFPNHFVNWHQYWWRDRDVKSRFHFGHAYSKRFTGALGVAQELASSLEELDADTWTFVDAFHRTTLPAPLKDAVQSNVSLVRSPTCMLDENGRFFAFEGCCGAHGRRVHSTGGCCPLNCTHVWNYEMTLSALFPSLERTMRESDLEFQMAPEGYIPHRTTYPLYLPRPWNQGIGGPDNPALDGMCGTVLKTLREYQSCGDGGWLRDRWPRVKRLLAYLMEHFDPDGDGVIDGEQPNTYDIHVYGPNTFIGSLWLAALLAGEEIALAEGEKDPAAAYRDRFETGSENYDRLLWNGEYYAQKYDAGKYTKHQWGDGCHSDQLLGQWWSHCLGLGYVLPRDHVRRALRSIVKYNFRRDFTEFRHSQRVYACGKDAGLLNCTWPRGGRPEVPILYCDEVWTGIEYEVASLLLWEGMVREAVEITAAARARHDGARRNPYNEIECGDHYARAMSSWSLLPAAAGLRVSAPEGIFEFAPCLAAEPFEAFFSAGTGWGTVRRAGGPASWTFSLEPLGGTVRLKTIRLGLPSRGAKVSRVAVARDGKKTAHRFEVKDETLEITLSRLANVPAGSSVSATVNG